MDSAAARRVHDKESESHVRFDSKQLSKDHDSEISVEAADASTRIIHLGFLQLHQIYSLEFDIEDDLDGDAIAKLPHSDHVQLTKFQLNQAGTGHHVSMTLHAYKDKLLREQFVVESEHSSSSGSRRSLTLVLLARVLGKYKGTPSLKTGIRCIGARTDASSSSSDGDDEMK